MNFKESILRRIIKEEIQQEMFPEKLNWEHIPAWNNPVGPSSSERYRAYIPGKSYYYEVIYQKREGMWLAIDTEGYEYVPLSWHDSPEDAMAAIEEYHTYRDQQ
jgi:hypothetical protein